MARLWAHNEMMITRWFRLYLAAIYACTAIGPSLVRADELNLEGNFTQGGLVQGRTHPKSKVRIGDRPVRVSAEGMFLIGFGRDAPTATRLVIIHPDGQREEHLLQIERRRYKIQRIDGLPPTKVTPSEEDLARIRAEIELVKETRLRDEPRTDFLSGFSWPLIGRISGVYGSQRILNGEPRQPHYGVDIAAPHGSVVVAPADGVVTLYHPDMFFSGGTLIIDHGHGLTSTFLHLHKVLVREGQHVRKGQRVAEVGATGRVTGPHLDWRINWFKQRLDPQLIVGPMPES